MLENTWLQDVLFEGMEVCVLTHFELGEQLDRERQVDKEASIYGCQHVADRDSNAGLAVTKPVTEFAPEILKWSL